MALNVQRLLLQCVKFGRKPVLTHISKRDARNRSKRGQEATQQRARVIELSASQCSSPDTKFLAHVLQHRANFAFGVCAIIVGPDGAR